MNLRNAGILITLTVIFQLTLPLGVNALNFTDSVQADFNQGERVNVTAAEGDLRLWQEFADLPYTKHGYIISRIFNTSEIVRWTGISWKKSLDELTQNITASIRFSNDSIVWTEWEEMVSGQSIGNIYKYAQYMANLSTDNELITPFLHNITLFYEYVLPEVSLNNPRDSYKTMENEVSFNCSVEDYFGLENITFYWNYSGVWEANETVNITGNSNSTVFTRTDLNEGNYIWGCLVHNTKSRHNLMANRSFEINFTTTMEINFSITPSVVEGENISISVNASSQFPIDSVWVVITMPNGTVNEILLIRRTVNYTALISGLYRITIYANDTVGNQQTAQALSSASEILTFKVNVIHPIIELLQTNLIVYLRGMEIYSYTMSGGAFTSGILDGTYELQFFAFNSTFSVMLRAVNISENLDKSITFDSVNPPESGFAATYFANTTYTFGSAEIKIYYGGSERILNESHLSMHVCNDWSLSERKCSGSWDRISSHTEEEEDFIKVSVGSLSAFSVKQEPFCGDSVCNHEIGETNTNCQVDCLCPTGERKTCGTTDIGACQYGTQTCVNGKWERCQGAIEASVELCNAKDDDCDDIIDNIEGGETIKETKCQCYGGNFPASETCNAVDDDCDSSIDEDIQRQCGRTDTGICDFGVSTCVIGKWSECLGEIGGRNVDICGNGMDDDCDGGVDEDCPDCSNGVQDGDEEGVDCGGGCSNACPEFPWLLMIVGGVVLLVVAIVLVLLKKRNKGPKWDELEKRYMYSPPEAYY